MGPAKCSIGVPTGVPMMCRWAYGVPANLMYAPVSLLVTDSPVVFGSNGHMIIQCGPIVMAGLARKAVAAFAQDHFFPLHIGADDPGGVGNLPWTRSYRPHHLDFCRLARSTAALIDVHVTVIVRLLHLRSNRVSLAQQQTSRKDDHQAIASDELHKFPP